MTKTRARQYGRLFLGTLAAGCAAAAADPCKAIPDRGPAPAYLSPGSTFAGPVVYVGDGDSLCVAVGDGPQAWVEVRLADFYAPELHEPAGPAAKAALTRLAMGKRATCRADHQSYDRMVARCEIGGRSALGRRCGGR
jgi:endonuclease YncB( thermonuclease family)